jgi:hypothetical protein
MCKRLCDDVILGRDPSAQDGFVLADFSLTRDVHTSRHRAPSVGATLRRQVLPCMGLGARVEAAKNLVHDLMLPVLLWRVFNLLTQIAY